MTKAYSVEIAQNGYNDDLFTGTFDECVDYIKKHGYDSPDNDVRIALVQTDNGIITDTLDIYFPEDFI